MTLNYFSSFSNKRKAREREEEVEAIMGADEEVNLLVLDLVEVVVEEEEAGHEEDG